MKGQLNKLQTIANEFDIKLTTQFDEIMKYTKFQLFEMDNFTLVSGIIYDDYKPLIQKNKFITDNYSNVSTKELRENVFSEVVKQLDN